jgi:membrane protease YdiL (CAAX protease family)
MGFLQNATKGRNDLVLYLLGFVLIGLGYFLGSTPLSIAAFFAIRKHGLGIDVLEKFEETLDFSLLHMDSNIGLILMIMLFVFTLAFLFIALKIHKKKILDIITSRPTIDYNRILFSLGIWLLFGAVLELFLYLLIPDNYILTFELKKFLPLLLIGIFLLPIQTTTEELVFRGYMLQGLSLIIKQKWVIILITAILFSMVHSANPEIEKFGFWTMQLYYVGAGVLLALITILDEGLELAIGIHAATNFYGAVLVGYSGGVLQTDSIWKTVILNPWFMIVIFYISSIVFYMICSKKYNWKPLKSIFEPIISENEYTSI